MKPRNKLALILLASLFASSATAAVSPEEAKKLGGPELTEWGAERGANKEGTIPAWTGEKVKAPAAWDPKEPMQLPDPFGDKPIYTITAQNMNQYADKLTEGMKGLFKTYPNFRMDVYPTRRTGMYPKYILENSVKNAASCKAVNNGLRLEGCWAGIPFPIPKTGNEAVWNHLTGYVYRAFTGYEESWVVAANGDRLLQGLQHVWYHFPFWDSERKGPAEPSSPYWKLRFETEAPARRVGEKYIIISSLDPINPGQRAWVYIPGQRRVKLAPDLAYDTPSPASGGSSTMDEQQTFLGAQDRYDMTLVGKKETYLMVNSNKLADYKTCPIDVALTKNFMNPDCVRWELRRTWEVKAKLKPGFRHIIPTRTMYFDEDTPAVAAGDMYDASGKIYRVDFSYQFIDYTANPQVSNSQTAVTYDLQTGVYATSAMYGIKGGGVKEIAPMPGTFYSPDGLAGEGIR